MKIARQGEGTVVIAEGGFTGRRLAKANDGHEVLILEFEAGARVAPHVSPFDMEFYVLEGRGMFVDGEEKATLNAGELGTSSAGVPHGISNLGPGRLRVLAIKGIGGH